MYLLIYLFILFYVFINTQTVCIYIYSFIYTNCIYIYTYKYKLFKYIYILHLSCIYYIGMTLYLSEISISKGIPQSYCWL